MGVWDQARSGGMGSALWRGVDVGVLVSVMYRSWPIDARGEVDGEAVADAGSEAMVYPNDVMVSLLPLCPFSANPVP